MQYRQSFKYPLENSGSDLEDMEEDDPEAYNVFAELLRANVDEAVSDSDTDFDYVPEDGPIETDESINETTTDDERMSEVQQSNADTITAAEEVSAITDSKASEESSDSYFTSDNNEAAGTSAGKSDKKTTKKDLKKTENADSSDDSNFTSDMDIASGSTKQNEERPAVYDMDEDEEDDETVRAIIAAIKKPRSAPPEIKMEEFITDICFHPERDIVALATITGDVALYQYGIDGNTLLRNVEVHAKSCRDVEFTEDGRFLLTCSKDKSIMVTDMETEKLKKFYESAHLDAINKLHVIDENLFVTGDDAGMVKLWDLRTRHAIFALKEVEDYITQMITNDAKKLLLITSGDGYLTTINIGARKLYVQSEPYEDELNCMGIYRGDSKLVVGTGKGLLYTYNWGQFGYHCDMYPGVKSQINQMIPITDRIGCVAGEEGIIRAVHIAPYRNLGIVGQHSLPVECMDINHSGELIASSAHDHDVRFWNIKYFEDFADIKYNEKHNNFKDKRHNLPSSKFSNASDFFSDLAKESSDNE